MNKMSTLKTELSYLFTRQTLAQAICLIANVSEALKKKVKNKFTPLAHSLGCLSLFV